MIIIMYSISDIIYTQVANPEISLPNELPEIPKSVFEEHLAKVRKAMEKWNLDSLVVYADKEHFSNFFYLVGFEPRFEEGILVVHKENPTYVLLGNECYVMHKCSKIEVEPILFQIISLPNQPLDKIKPMDEIFKDAKIKEGSKVGIVGFKLFRPEMGYDIKKMFDLPSYLLDAIIQVVGNEDNIINATDMFIHPGTGVRVTITPDDVPFLEYGAAWSSKSVMNILDSLEVGKTEMDVAQAAEVKGLPLTSHILGQSGHRAAEGLFSPSSKKIELGDAFNTSCSLRGGLTCRTGVVANSIEDLPESIKDYIEVIVKPYYAAIASWYEIIGIGVKGGDLYDKVSSIYPAEKYGWTLNLGHFTSYEEWLSSPVFKGSEIEFKSGQLMQMDIIPGPEAPYAGSNVEDGLLIADEEFRKELKEKYPDLYDRMQKRRDYMINELNIKLKPEILPMSNSSGLLRPLMLNKTMGMKVKA